MDRPCPDVFLTKFNPAGAALVYSSYLGGTKSDWGTSLALDSLGNAYITGTTDSSNFPTRIPFQSAYGGSGDAFIAKVEEPKPILEIEMSKTTYVNGDTVTASIFTMKNQASTQAVVELKVWLTFPGAPEISILNVGADGSFALPPNFTQNMGPISLFSVDGNTMRGTYEFSSRMLIPVTGKLLSEDLNFFTVQ